MSGSNEPPAPPLPKGSPPPAGSSSSGPPAGGAPFVPASAPPQGGAASPSSSQVLDPRSSARFMSMGSHHILQLREEAAKYEKLAFKERHKASKLDTSMEKHKHSSTALRDREQATLAKIPDLEGLMNEQQKMLQMGASGTSTGAVSPKEQSKIHVKIRKIQQKMANLQRRAKTLEHKAAHHMQIASQKKVLSDMHVEKAKQWEQEARSYTLMADRMQKATEPETLAPNLGR